MPRRKIVAGPEEIEYRLLGIIRMLGKVNGAQALSALGAVAGLAHLYNVDLGEDFRNIVRKATSSTMNPSSAKVPQADPGTVNPIPGDSKEPLTIQPPDDIFGGLGGSDEDEA